VKPVPRSLWLPVGPRAGSAGTTPLRRNLTSVPSTPFATSEPSAESSPPARRLHGQAPSSRPAGAHSPPAGRLHGQTAATAVEPALPRSAGASAVEPALPRSSRCLCGQPALRRSSRCLCGQPALRRSSRRFRGQPGGSAVEPALRRSAQRLPVLTPSWTVNDEPQIELTPHWSRPSQAIRRECPIHAAPATWLGHSHRINQPLSPHRSCIWWNRCPRYHSA
jgi:hypothetical protein